MTTNCLLVGLADLLISLLLIRLLFIGTIRRLKKRVAYQGCIIERTEKENAHLYQLLGMLDGAEVYRIVQEGRSLFFALYKTPDSWKIYLCSTPAHLLIVSSAEISLKEPEAVLLQKFYVAKSYLQHPLGNQFITAFLEKLLALAESAGKHWLPFQLAFDGLEDLQAMKELFEKFHFTTRIHPGDTERNTLTIEPPEIHTPVAVAVR